MPWQYLQMILSDLLHIDIRILVFAWWGVYLITYTISSIKITISSGYESEWCGRCTISFFLEVKAAVGASRVF